MTTKSRLDFLLSAAQAAGAASALSMLPMGIRNALAIPANNRTGSIQDVEHIVVLMQENRSFDHYFDILKRDVQANTLPQVSWIVAPEAYSEHPNWPTNYGAWYIDQVLQVLTSNPEVWSKTVLLINYDENDSFFDHLAPPFAPASSANGLSTVDTSYEFFAGNATYAAGPYRLGPRVPMIAVSPWSKGGYVCSEVFDHTSVIRFIEQRFGSPRCPAPLPMYRRTSYAIRTRSPRYRRRKPCRSRNQACGPRVRGHTNFSCARRTTAQTAS
jgi:phospholipase C